MIRGPKLPSRDPCRLGVTTWALGRRLPPSSPPSGPKPVWQSPAPTGRSQLGTPSPFLQIHKSSGQKSVQQTFAGTHQDRSPSESPSQRRPKPVALWGEKARPGEGRNQNPSGKWKPETHPSSGRNQSSSGRWKSFETVTEAKVSREVRARRGKGRNQNPFRKVEVRAPQSLGRNRSSSGARLTKTSIDSEPRLFVFQRHPRPRSRALPTREEPRFQASLRVSLSNLSSIVPSLHNSFDSSAA